MTTATHSNSIPVTIWAGLGAAVLTLLGTFLPWASTPFGSISGISGDGLIVAIGAAGAAGVYGYSATKRALDRRFAIGALVLGGLMAALSIYHVFNIKKELAGIGSPGLGLYLCVVGSLAVAGVAGHRVFRG